jgi:hypothetical protein
MIIDFRCEKEELGLSTVRVYYVVGRLSVEIFLALEQRIDGVTLCFMTNCSNSARMESDSDLRFCWVIVLVEFDAESSNEFNLSRNNSIAQVDIIVF